MKNVVVLITALTMMGCSKSGDNSTTTPPDFTDTSKKIEVACPEQDSNTAVLFAFGQSNASNYAERLYQNADARIINFYNGHCYIASDPMLGASGTEGSVWIPFAQRILNAGTYNQIIIMTSGIGGTAVERWADGGDLHVRYVDRLNEINHAYTVTHYLWHQGEANAMNNTTGAQYKDRIENVIDSALASSPNAKFFVSVATRCDDERWYYDLENGQRAVVNGVNILSGPDTDNGIPLEMRRPDHCHMSTAAQEVFADLWFAALNQ